MRFQAVLLAVLAACAGLGGVWGGEIENPLPAIQRMMERADEGLRAVDSCTYEGPKNFLTDYPARNPDGTINAVVEIPAGSSAKWEVKSDGNLHWDMKDGRPRVVRYLPYPCDYGMIPHTRAADGDPLDIVILGPAIPRGSVVEAVPIGIMKLTDKGEKDDKVVAVMADTPLAHVTSIEQLESEFPGTAEILRHWFVNYKGPNAMPFGGFGDTGEAKSEIDSLTFQ